MITSVGKFLRKLRIDSGEVLRDMANNLGVSSAFLSAVENGKKKFPEAWNEKLTEIYKLTPNQVEEMKEAIIESTSIIKLNIENASQKNRDLAVKFARNFDSIDDETRDKIFNILSKSKGD